VLPENSGVWAYTSVLNPAFHFVSGQIFSAPRKVDLCAPFLFATEKAPATPEVHATIWPSWS
jgi:hypothetical protein